MSEYACRLWSRFMFTFEFCKEPISGAHHLFLRNQHVFVAMPINFLFVVAMNSVGLPREDPYTSRPKTAHNCKVWQTSTSVVHFSAPATDHRERGTEGASFPTRKAIIFRNDHHLGPLSTPALTSPESVPGGSLSFA